MKKCHHKHHPLDSLYCKFCELIDTILDLLGNEICSCPVETQQNGELQVTGKDEIIISLEAHPNHVKVFFDDSVNSVPCAPCNPGHDDELEWEVRVSEDDCQYDLHIEWDVSGARDIFWKVCY